MSETVRDFVLRVKSEEPHLSAEEIAMRSIRENERCSAGGGWTKNWFARTAYVKAILANKGSGAASPNPRPQRCPERDAAIYWAKMDGASFTEIARAFAITPARVAQLFWREFESRRAIARQRDAERLAAINGWPLAVAMAGQDAEARALNDVLDAEDERYRFVDPPPPNSAWVRRWAKSPVASNLRHRSR